MGIYYKEHMLQSFDSISKGAGPLTQNCIQMFDTNDILGFILRFDMFLLAFSPFPILFHFFRSGILKIIFSQLKKKKK